MAQYITYFDEVKANPTNGQFHYVVGGLAVPLEAIADLEAQLNALARQTFGTTDLTTKTEFHGSHIYFGKGAFKGWPPADRINVLAELGRIVNAHEGVRRVYAAIDTSKLYAGASAAEIAFAYFCERVQMLTGKAGTTILIGDLDDELARQMIRDFATFRASGTPWDYGIAITNIVDAVHFARSHHSRMVQLADAYLFLLTHRWGTRKGWFSKKLTEALANVETYGHRYKEWPN